MGMLTFWFEFASTYSYLSAMRVGRLAREAGVEVVWKPFLLGPLFKAQGWASSPFNLYPAKGAYMVRDLARIAEERGLVFRLPHPFPQNSLQASRLALVGLAHGWGETFVREVYRLQFAEGRNISEEATLIDALRVAGVSPDAALAEASTAAIKDKLRANTDEAQDKGLFGAPSFTTRSGELFWGDDRLEQALVWSVR